MTENIENIEETENGIENENGDVFAKISEQIAANAPDVSEHVIEQEIENMETLWEVNSEPPPKPDELFDAEIHAVDENGHPILTKSGKYRRKPGRKRRIAQQHTQSGGDSQLGGIDNKSGGQHSDQVTINADAETIAFYGTLLASRLRDSLSTVTVTEQEQQFLHSMFKHWANDTDAALSPNVGLILGLSVFMMPIITQPKPKGIVERIKAKIGSLFGGKKRVEKTDNEE